MPGRKGLLAVLVLGVGSLALGQQPPKIKRAPPENVSAANGPQMFRAYCAVCHGVDARGAGPAASALRKQPADLTQLSRKNNGKYPVYRVVNVIQGADVIASHGSRDMPVWGAVFRTMEPDTVKLRIDNLASYIESIQRQ